MITITLSGGHLKERQQLAHLINEHVISQVCATDGKTSDTIDGSTYDENFGEVSDLVMFAEKNNVDFCLVIK